MRGYNFVSNNGGRSQANEHWAHGMFLGVLLFVAFISQAQVPAGFNNSRIDVLAAPSLFANMSSMPPSRDISNDLAPSLQPTRIPTFPPITHFELYRGFNRLHRSSTLRNQLTRIAEQLNKDKPWQAGTPIYHMTPYAKSHQKRWEHYIRHIPTAGPIVGRVCRQAQAHPNFIRVLSMFRPDF